MVLNPEFPIQQGLDLKGGLQVLLEADVPEDRPIDVGDIDTARQIVGQRVNALGVVEPLVQVEGERRILVELPGIENPQLERHQCFDKFHNPFPFLRVQELL